MIEPDNRRGAPRFFCNVPAVAQGPKGPMRCQCVNLSTSGMYVLGFTLPVGNSVTFTLSLPKVGEAELVGEVRHHFSDERGRGMGIHFTRLTEDSRARLQRFVESLGPPM